tara:strand:- start:1367 stop:1735 length:369 start_codon:yes stop_codon:yes gene_type:complete
MKKRMEDILDSIWDFLKMMFYIIIGASVRIMHYAKKNTVNKKRVIITFTFAVFVGVIVNHLLIIKNLHEWSGIAVSIAALLGESFVSYLLTNSNNIFRTFINSIFKIDVDNKLENKEEDKVD